MRVKQGRLIEKKHYPIDTQSTLPREVLFFRSVQGSSQTRRAMAVTPEKYDGHEVKCIGTSLTVRQQSITRVVYHIGLFLRDIELEGLRHGIYSLHYSFSKTKQDRFALG